MSVALIFVFIAFLLLICFAYFAHHRRKSMPEFGEAYAALRSLDLDAFRNLMDPGEDAFLRRRLPASQYRTIKRERTCAALAYVRELSDASLQFTAIGEAARRSPNPVVAASGRQIANSAISLRLAALEASVRLRISAAFPGMDSNPVRSLLDQYHRATVQLHDHGALQARNQAT
jgi:hypothetical protein